MEIQRFNYEGRQYVLALIKNREFMLWTETDDPFSWGAIEQSSEPINGIKNPTKLVRKVWQLVRKHIYKNKLPYFEIWVSDTKRSNLYGRFLKNLSGYQFFKHGYNFTVIRTKGIDHADF